MPAATKERKAKATKKVQLIARYALKRNAAIVIYTVRSSNGNDMYNVTLYNGHASGCTCPATRECYHMAQVEVIEEKRIEEMCEAIALAPIIVGESFAQDIEAHVEDEFSGEQAAYAILESERRALAPLNECSKKYEEGPSGAMVLMRAS